MRARVLTPAILTSVLLMTSGCASTVHLGPARGANTVACAAVTVRLPNTLGGLKERDTNAQATGAWGNPIDVFERCGVSSPRVSPIQCFTFGGVDWLVDVSNQRYIHAVTYGRDPAVEVVMTSDTQAPGRYLEELAPAVSQLPVERRCL